MCYHVRLSLFHNSSFQRFTVNHFINQRLQTAPAGQFPNQQFYKPTTTPFHHVHSQPYSQSISYNRFLDTVYRVTDNRLNSGSQFIDPLRSTVQSFYNPMIHWIMIHHLKIQQFQKINRFKKQTIPTVKSSKQQPRYQSGFPNNKPCPGMIIKFPR